MRDRFIREVRYDHAVLGELSPRGGFWTPARRRDWWSR